MFKLYCDIALLLRGDGQPSGDPPHSTTTCTYFEAKQSISHYQGAKIRLLGEGCTFAGWVTSGIYWESFTPNMKQETSVVGQGQEVAAGTWDYIPQFRAKGNTL